MKRKIGKKETPCSGCNEDRKEKFTSDLLRKDGLDGYCMKCKSAKAARCYQRRIKRRLEQ